jgi:hypothetical protein
MTMKKSILATSIILLLSACGGGGGATTDSTQVIYSQREKEAAAIILSCNDSFYTSIGTSVGASSTADGRISLGNGFTFMPVSILDAPVKICVSNISNINEIEPTAASVISASTNFISGVRITAGGAFSAVKEKTLELGESWLGSTENEVKAKTRNYQIFGFIKDAYGRWSKVPMSTTKTYTTDPLNIVFVLYKASIDYPGYYFILANNPTISNAQSQP